MGQSRVFTEQAGGTRFLTFGGLKKVTGLEEKNPFENIYIDQADFGQKTTFLTKIGHFQNLTFFCQKSASCESIAKRLNTANLGYLLSWLAVFIF